jgi:hypothetical protein
LRAEAAQGIPGSTLFGRRDDPGRALRLHLRGVQPASALGEFSLWPRQDEARVLFVPIATLQGAFGQAGRVNLVLARGEGAPALAADLARAATLEDPRAAPARGRDRPFVVARERRRAPGRRRRRGSA